MKDCQAAVKSFSPSSLGQGHGRESHGSARARGPEFREQTNDWKWFKEAWDQNRADAHGPAWGLIFAETMQGVLKDTADGTPNAISKFMHQETSKHLMGTPMLRV